MDEVTDLFDQYQLESGQIVEPEVVGSVYESTNGQPGLVGWFGELLTDLFSRSDIPFNLRANWCSYLYLNGIISYTTQQKNE